MVEYLVIALVVGLVAWRIYAKKKNSDDNNDQNSAGGGSGGGNPPVRPV